MFDPLYYPSTYEWDESVRRLERWMLEQSDPDTVVLTGDETGEWIAALTGRRVVSGVRLLGRDEARQHRRRLRQLFLSSEPSEMHSAFDALGAGILVLDPELREVYWELDERLLESSPRRAAHRRIPSLFEESRPHSTRVRAARIRAMSVSIVIDGKDRVDGHVI